MKLATLTAVALLAAAPTAFAQSARVPNPADPAPANPKATNGMSTEAPARGDSATTGRSMSRDSDTGMSSKDMQPGPGTGNPDHANGGNGPGGRY